MSDAVGIGTLGAGAGEVVGEPVRTYIDDEAADDAWDAMQAGLVGGLAASNPALGAVAAGGMAAGSEIIDSAQPLVDATGTALATAADQISATASEATDWAGGVLKGAAQGAGTAIGGLGIGLGLVGAALILGPIILAIVLIKNSDKAAKAYTAVHQQSAANLGKAAAVLPAVV